VSLRLRLRRQYADVVESLGRNVEPNCIRLGGETFQGPKDLAEPVEESGRKDFGSRIALINLKL